MPPAYDTDSIFKKYKDKVYRLALSISRNEKDAEDITQNTFLKIIKNLMYFRNKSQLSTWIYKIAYNEALMHLRKRKSQFKLSGYLKRAAEKTSVGLFVNWAKLPDKELLDSELKQRIDSAIAHMPIKYRMPLLLDNAEGLPLKDSAKIMGLKVNSLKTRLHRAHLLIKQDITSYFRDQENQEENKDKRCGVWSGFVYDYAKGYLDKKRSRVFKRHITDCVNCNSFLDTYLKAINVTGALECQDLPVELKDKIETFLSLKHLNLKKGRVDMVKTITRDELMKMISTGQEFKLVDVLPKAHFEKEHIKGAISLPVNELEKKATKTLKKSETIVVYCASFDCQASTTAAEKLLSLGYKNVLDYKGGLKDYKEAALPLEGSLHGKASQVASRCSSC